MLRVIRLFYQAFPVLRYQSSLPYISSEDDSRLPDGQMATSRGVRSRAPVILRLRDPILDILISWGGHKFEPIDGGGTNLRPLLVFPCCISHMTLTSSVNLY